MNRPSPDDMKAMGVVDYVTELEMENKKLKEENMELKAYKTLCAVLKERINRQIELQKRITLKKNKMKKEDIILICFIIIMIAFTIYLGYLKSKSYIEGCNYCVERYK